MEYYVIKNKETGNYFRGKGTNKWGENILIRPLFIESKV